MPRPGRKAAWEDRFERLWSKWDTHEYNSIEELEKSLEKLKTEKEQKSPNCQEFPITVAEIEEYLAFVEILKRR